MIINIYKGQKNLADQPNNLKDHLQGNFRNLEISGIFAEVWEMAKYRGNFSTGELCC